MVPFFSYNEFKSSQNAVSYTHLDVYKRQGKTGTTDDSKDAWFVGYTPDLVAAVWIGDDYGSETLRGMTGGDTPAIMWGQFMANALANTPASDFSVPASAQSAVSEGYYNPVKAQPKKEAAKDEKADKKDDKDKSNDEAVKDDSCLLYTSRCV